MYNDVVFNSIQLNTLCVHKGHGLVTSGVWHMRISAWVLSYLLASVLICFFFFQCSFCIPLFVTTSNCLSFHVPSLRLFNRLFSAFFFSFWFVFPTVVGLLISSADTIKFWMEHCVRTESPFPGSLACLLCEGIDLSFLTWLSNNYTVWNPSMHKNHDPEMLWSAACISENTFIFLGAPPPPICHRSGKIWQGNC